MGQGLRSPKCTVRSERRSNKPRQNTFGRSPYHRRLACEPLEDRRLLSVATITDAWIKLGTLVDHDNDGFASALTLEFDSKVSDGTMSVYANVHADDWLHLERDLGNSSDYTLTTTDTRQTFIVPVESSDLSHTTWDFQIDLYKTGTTERVARLGMGADPDLNDMKIERAADDRMVRWEDSDGSELDDSYRYAIGSTVYMAAYGSSGQTVSVALYEDDGLFADDFIHSYSITIEADGKGRMAWSIGRYSDADGWDILPEYVLKWDGIESKVLKVRDDGNPGLHTGVTILGVPSYEWHYGCAPTAFGMVVGYWDAYGYPKLIPGDASSITQSVEDTIASLAHITAGSENKPTTDWGDGDVSWHGFGDWHDSSSYPNHEETPDCIADFIKTVDGGSYSSNYVSGITNFLDYRGYDGWFLSQETWGEFTWSALTTSIDAGQPLVFSVDSDADGRADHATTVIGYDATTYEYATLNTDGGSWKWYDFAPVAQGNVYGIDSVTYLYPTMTSQRLDLIFCIDTTSSMWDDIDAAKAAATDIINLVATSVPDYRIAVVDYRDFPNDPYGASGDYPYHDVQAFTTNKDSAISAIQSLSLGDGKDWNESVYSAAIHCIDATSLGGWRGQPVKKVIVLMGDAPPHDPEPYTGYTMAVVTKAAEEADPVVCFPIVVGGDSNTESYFGSLADGTGGKLFAAATASDVVDAIKSAINTITDTPFSEAGGPYTGMVGTPISFDASGSYDPDGTIVKYEWDWDSDGTYDLTSAYPSATHTWSAPFSGTVRMRVTDNDDLTSYDTASVDVSAVVNNLLGPRLWINDVSRDEGNSGVTTFNFTICLTGSNPDGASVSYATADGIATTADGDYVFQNGTLTWSAGDTSARAVSITVNSDANAESDDVFYVNLSGASAAVIADNQGKGIVQNDDVPNESLIALTNPNGGEFLMRGSSANITWLWTGNPGANVKIDLYKSGLFNRTITASTPNNGSYSWWAIPTSLTAGSDYQIRITSTSDPSCSDLSDNTFFITSPTAVTKIGMFAVDVNGQGWWYSDLNGNGYWDSGDTRTGFGWKGCTPVVGDWNGDGRTEIGVWAADGNGQGWWYYDMNGNGWWDSADRQTAFGWAGSTPVVGDWNGDGKTDIGTWAADSTGQGWWYYDRNGNGWWDTADGKTAYGWASSTPVVGDWNRDGKSEIGTWASDGHGQGWWYYDMNGNGWWDTADRQTAFGWAGSTPVVGDWNRDGKSEIATYAVDGNGQGMWYYDLNGNGWWDGSDSKNGFGCIGSMPTVGAWTNSLALHAANVASSPATGVSLLTQNDLQPIIKEAIARWSNASLDAATIAKLTKVQFVISDLSGSYLGEADATMNRIYLDTNAAGNGWFIDPTPALNEEFMSSRGGRQLRAIDPRAVDRIDLLTVVEHELGHIAGFDDLDAVANNVMDGVLGVGVRRIPLT